MTLTEVEFVDKKVNSLIGEIAEALGVDEEKAEDMVMNSIVWRRVQRGK